MAHYVSEELRIRIRDLDQGRCAYCRTGETNSGIRLTIDHIQPVSQGGSTALENLCLACYSCNEFKSDHAEAADPLTDETCALFNPRSQHWADHFEWSADGTHITGLTAPGRATVMALRMNNEVVVSARRRWVSASLHPPEE